jgi:hypothetical protein
LLLPGAPATKRAKGQQLMNKNSKNKTDRRMQPLFVAELGSVAGGDHPRYPRGPILTTRS